MEVNKFQILLINVTFYYPSTPPPPGYAPAVTCDLDGISKLFLLLLGMSLKKTIGDTCFISFISCYK